jgi:hypothetical protein
MPDDVRVLDTLTDPSYTYACEIATSATDQRSAEQWARAVQEGGPVLLRWFIVFGWIVALRLRLGPRSSPELVLGWKVLSTTPTAIVLGVESFMLSAHLVVCVQDSRVVHATFVRYKRWPARIIWPPGYEEWRARRQSMTGFDQVVPDVQDAADKMTNGDRGPYVAHWSHGDPGVWRRLAEARADGKTVVLITHNA